MVYRSVKLTNITKTLNPRHLIALHKFQTGPSPRGNKRQTILLPKSINKTNRIPPTNNRSNSFLSPANDRSHD